MRAFFDLPTSLSVASMPQASTSKRVLDLTDDSLAPKSSQKTVKLANIFLPPLKIDYKEGLIQETCWHFTWGKPIPRHKVLALDLDGTVIKPKSKSPFPKDEFDWNFLYPKIPERLKLAYEEGFSIVFISNQAGNPKQQLNFRKKLPLIAKRLQIPFHAFAAFNFDQFRKPSPGMFIAYERKCSQGVDIDYASSFYIGDAAGRPGNPARNIAKDHNDTDRKMAENVGLKFLTPEEFFLKKPIDSNWNYSGWNPKTFQQNSVLPLNILPALTLPASPPEVVIFVALPAAGKTSFYKRNFAPLGYVHVNQDTLKTRANCLKLVQNCLTAIPPKSCVVDNTSPSLATRQEYYDLVKRVLPSASIRVFHFATPLEVAKHNSVYRALYEFEETQRKVLPYVAFTSYAANFQEPTEAEGVQVVQIPFRFEGTEAELKRWQSWLDTYPKIRGKKSTN